MVGSVSIYTAHVPEGFEWVHPMNHSDFELFRSFDGTPRRKSWIPVAMERVTEDEGKRFAESDLPWLGGHVLVLRTRAIDALGPALTAAGELLPLACVDADLWVFNVLRIVDALDEDQSEIVRFPGGRIMTIESYAFRPEVASGLHVFKLPQFLRGPLFFNDDFVQLVATSGLRGVAFERVWDSSAAASG